MSRFTTNNFVLLLAFCLSVGLPCHAAPVVKTTPHVFPLHHVNWPDEKGPIVPVIALKADFVAYPNLPSYKEFLDAPEDSPERAIVRYIELLYSDRGALSPQTLSAAKNFYAEDERHERNKSITSTITTDYSNITKNPDVRLWHRYDAGALSIITLAFTSPHRIRGVQPFETIYLLKKDGTYVFTKKHNGPIDLSKPQDTTDGVVLRNIIDLNESNMVYWPNLAEVAQPNYPYHFSLPIFVPGVTSAPNSFELLFIGRPSNILVDKNMVPADQTQAIVKRAVQAQRNGSKAVDVSAQDLGFVSFRGEVRIVFTIDFEVGALVFLRDSNSKELHLIRVRKKAPDGSQLKEMSDILPGNLQPLFNSSSFQSYASDQIDDFAARN